jgi:hypothetical protein
MIRLNLGTIYIIRLSNNYEFCVKCIDLDEETATFQNRKGMQSVQGLKDIRNPITSST